MNRNVAGINHALRLKGHKCNVWKILYSIDQKKKKIIQISTEQDYFIEELYKLNKKYAFLESCEEKRTNECAASCVVFYSRSFPFVKII